MSLCTGADDCKCQTLRTEAAEFGGDDERTCLNKKCAHDKGFHPQPQGRVGRWRDRRGNEESLEDDDGGGGRGAAPADDGNAVGGGGGATPAPGVNVQDQLLELRSEAADLRAKVAAQAAEAARKEAEAAKKEAEAAEKVAKLEAELKSAQVRSSNLESKVDAAIVVASRESADDSVSSIGSQEARGLPSDDLKRARFILKKLQALKGKRKVVRAVLLHELDDKDADKDAIERMVEQMDEWANEMILLRDEYIEFKNRVIDLSVRSDLD